MAYNQKKDPELLRLVPVYLSFMHYMQRKDGRFRNFLSFSRRFLDETGSEDSFGRSIRALGYLMKHAPNHSYIELALEIYHKATPNFSKLKFIRGSANTLIGIARYLKVQPWDDVQLRQLNDLAGKMVTSFYEHSTKHWQWFEEIMTYDNAILPLALLHAYDITENPEYLAVARKSSNFLEKTCFDKGYFSPVGNRGWYPQNGKKAQYDQQAVEALATIQFFSKAFELMHDPHYLQRIYQTYKWFLGENDLRLPLFDQETKGCCDGLEANGINRNQGAESTLAYLISHAIVLDNFNTEYQFSQNKKTTKQPVKSLGKKL